MTNENPCSADLGPPRHQGAGRVIIPAFTCGDAKMRSIFSKITCEIVTNAIRVSGGLDADKEAAPGGAVIRLWVSVEDDANSVLVMVWDASPEEPKPQEPELDAMSGRGLLLVEMYSSAWGCFQLVNKPGKVVWALCQV